MGMECDVEDTGNPIIHFLGRSRTVIEQVTPEIDGGRFPIKRSVGEGVVVEAAIFGDGHDVTSALLKYRVDKDSSWSEKVMEPLVNDLWRGEFTITQSETYRYTIEAWVDHFVSWQKDLKKKIDAQQDVSVELLIGAELVAETAKRATSSDADALLEHANRLRAPNLKNADPIQLAFDTRLIELMTRYPDRQHSTVYERELGVVVDPERARFSAWYEMFPRSAGEPGHHGTFKDCEMQLERIARMGFDVLYFPPIHPIGRSFRKGKNNNVACQLEDVGSPWAIGSAEGGHKSIHPDLGTLEDFRQLLSHASQLGIEIALDIAFQCAPDHPYITRHPEWFRHRPDGTIQYAENPPKKYQDIVPFDFECEAWERLWLELKSIFDFWIEQGVKIFRVDNPHTKAFPFWEWCLGGLRAKHPELIFLAEAFTRPHVLNRLAKIGFTQSYNYFPWRNTKDELTAYFTSLSQSPLADFLRPNLWPNTPDILTEFLQHGGRPAFIIRLILAATLGTSYGIYGPTFELCENTPREAGSEEYLNSEKYEIRAWDLKSPDSLEGLLTRVNRIRRENAALQFNYRLKFHDTDNPQLLAYSKSTEDGSNTVLTVINLSPHYVHSGWIELSMEDLGVPADQSFQMHDQLTDMRFLWHGRKNYVQLSPHIMPAHIFRVRRYLRSERDFDYYL
jgi:starch synthase (maltosyl-transferring)